MTATESVLLDTSIIIAHFRQDPELTELLKSATLYVPLTVLGELYYGAFKAQQQVNALKHVQEFLSVCAVLPPDEETAEHYGQIKADLDRRGSRIPENDIWIAALAQEHQLPLVTRDQHFKSVPNLTLLHW
jgi:tRNA(fMet)-specific endonuclease VapC